MWADRVAIASRNNTNGVALAYRLVSTFPAWSHVFPGRRVPGGPRMDRSCLGYLLAGSKPMWPETNTFPAKVPASCVGFGRIGLDVRAAPTGYAKLTRYAAARQAAFHAGFSGVVTQAYACSGAGAAR